MVRTGQHSLEVTRLNTGALRPIFRFGGQASGALERTIRRMALTGLIALVATPPPAHAEEDASWSSGYYRADPTRSPFRIQPEPSRPHHQDDEAPVDRWRPGSGRSGSESQRQAPPIWKPDRYQQHLSERNRPWGTIPAEPDHPVSPGEPDPNHGPDRDRWLDEPARASGHRPPLAEDPYYRSSHPDDPRAPQPASGVDPHDRFFHPDDPRAPRAASGTDPYPAFRSGEREERSRPAFWDGPYQKEYVPQSRPEWNRDSSGVKPQESRSPTRPDPSLSREPPRSEERWWGQRGDDRYWDEPGRNRYWPEER
ncbi:MAG: hypothetical protein HQL99_05010 [Magnetococcales bacterium]|nr:hypothetical protein [Magnetococcales bacterium]